MEISELEAFVAVVEEKSFSRAAARLHRTQPAASQAVRRLESWAGAPLLDRSAKSGVLTEAGRIVYDHAKRVLNLRTETGSALAELQALERGRVTVGANESTALYLLPVLETFRRLHPKVQVAVERSLSRQIPAALLRHEMDLGVLSYDPHNAELESTVVALDELCLIVPPGHRLAGAAKVSVRDLGAESFLAHNVASPFRRRVIETFEQLQTPLNIIMELPTVETIKKAVRLGMGVAFAPRMCLEDELARRELVSVPVSELHIERQLRLIYRKNSTLSAAARAFLETAKGDGTGSRK